MKIIIATDIFGHGDYLRELSSQLKALCSSVAIVSPYLDQQVSINDETEAYEKFCKECGHDKFSALVKSEIISDPQQVSLIGFSAGASAIWHALGNYSFDNVVRFVGFYPSQIRHHLHLVPSCPTSIVFPRLEESFDVMEAAQALSAKSAVECQLTDLYHGFMNPQSKNYNTVAAKAFSLWLHGIVKDGQLIFNHVYSRYTRKD